MTRRRGRAGASAGRRVVLHVDKEAIGATVLLVKLGLDPGGILDRFGEDGLGFGRDAVVQEVEWVLVWPATVRGPAAF